MKIIFDVKKNLGILIILLSVFLVACSNDQVEVVEENKEVVSINVESLKFNIRRIPKIFIDAKEGDESALIIANNVYEGLMRETETGIEQAMAKNIAISDDYKKYTFTLRESYWSDGQVVKAQDFKNHIDQRLSESSVTDFVNLIGLESVVALDDRTLELKLSKSNTTFLDYLAEPEFFPKRVDTAEEVFNGPFRVSEIGKSHIRLEKNEMYWDSENINLESIEGAHIKIEEAVKKYSKDELDVVIDISSNYVEEKIISEENFIVFPQDSLYYYIFNEDKLGFSDSNEDKSVVRRKLFSAIDRTAIVENLNDVVMTLETLVVPKKILERDEDRFAFRQIIDSSIEQGATRYADYDELENPDEVIEITLRNNSPDEYAISTMVRDMWKKNLGISSIVSVLDDDQYLKALEEGDFQVIAVRKFGVADDPRIFLSDFYSSSPKNYGGYNNAFFDKYMRDAYSSGESIRNAWVRNALAIISKDEYVLPVCSFDAAMIIDEDIKGVYKTRSGKLYFGDVEANRKDAE